MAEEHRCEAQPEGPRLCANNCGFFGSPATLNLCSKCFRDNRLKEDQEASAMEIVSKSLIAPGLISHPDSSLYTAVTPVIIESPSPIEKEAETSSGGAAAAPPPRPGRCTACKRKVGLTGFRCRCGETFCGSHRYPEQHACSFDFKAVGRDAIARANPAIKSDKLEKI